MWSLVNLCALCAFETLPLSAFFVLLILVVPVADAVLTCSMLEDVKKIRYSRANADLVQASVDVRISTIGVITSSRKWQQPRTCAVENVARNDAILQGSTAISLIITVHNYIL